MYRPELQIGVVVEGCSLHVGPITKIDRDGDYVTHRSLFDGVERGCSMRHCGVIVMSQEDIDKRMKLWNDGGLNALNAFFQELCNVST